MGIPHNSYSRAAQRHIREARELTEQARQARRITPEDRERARERVRAEQQRRAELFDALQVGDRLTAFGHPVFVVAKKNPKSVITQGGLRWTRYDLTGVQ